jgi:hypothetical protein
MFHCFVTTNICSDDPMLYGTASVFGVGTQCIPVITVFPSFPIYKQFAEVSLAEALTHPVRLSCGKAMCHLHSQGKMFSAGVNCSVLGPLPTARNKKEPMICLYIILIILSLILAFGRAEENSVTLK